MKKAKTIFALILIAILPFLFTCGGGGGGGGGSTDGGGGGTTPEASATIGPSGGTVEVTNTSSPLYGVKVEIPAGALSKDTTITINKAVNLPSSPFESDSHGIVAEIGPSGTTFEVPATITIPYKDDADESFLGVFVYSEGEAGWIYLPFSFIDKNSNRAVFKISHLTPYYLTKFPKLRSGVHKFFIEEGFDETARATIQAAIRYGTFLPYFDCAGIGFQAVTSKNEADFVVRLGDPKRYDEDGILRDLPSGFQWTSATQAEIVIRNNIKLHVKETLDIPDDALDLYSLIVHELSHYLGIGTVFNNPTYPQNGVFDDYIGKGDIVRVLVSEDRDIFELKYPECKEETCPNIAGNWNFSSSGTVTCIYGGDSETEYPSGSGTAAITQNGCNVSWIVPGTDYSRSGTVTGNSIQVSGIFVVPLVSGVNITQNSYSASGTISEDTNTINLNGEGSAAGSYEGIGFTCTGTDEATLTRLSSTASTLKTMDEKKAIRKPSAIFLKNSLKLFIIVSP